MKTLDVKKLGSDINELILILSQRELKLLMFICIFFFVELFLHISIFVHLLMLSGISSIILAILFALICGCNSFGIWMRHGWSFTILFYIRKFRNNPVLMKYVAK